MLAAACQVDLAAVDHHGETALHLAIRGGSVDWFGGRRILASMRNFCFLGDLYPPPLNCSVLSVLSVVDRLHAGESAGTRSSLRALLLLFSRGSQAVVEQSIHSWMTIY